MFDGHLRSVKKQSVLSKDQFFLSAAINRVNHPWGKADRNKINKYKYKN
jgi:hypothetical protein